MNSAHANRFLETEVLTAPPQKLRLMLVDGALRGIAETKQAWQQGLFAEGGEALDRVQAIIAEFIGALDRQRDPALTGQLTELYVFLYKSLIAAGFEHNAAKLDEVVTILQIERDTWQELNRLLADSTANTAAAAAPIPAPHHSSGIHSPLSLGFSLEA